MRESWVYIVASGSRTLYIGVTSELEQRIWQHKTKRFEGFSALHNCGRLVYFEEFFDITEAITREKQLKGWSRAKKLSLIRRENPEFNDLAADWFEAQDIAAGLTENAAERSSKT
jgi:putative endonuclease